MASGKKGKKTKGKTLALTDFLQETTGSIPVQQPIRKSTINWADEVEDYDAYNAHKPVNVVLPTAPKASRDYEDFSDKVPKDPPYIAYLSNLPYDVDEDEIASFFKGMRVASMRIPKDDRSADGPRCNKGYGYVEFEDRDSLMNALVLPDIMLKNRKMRIEVAANAENDRRRGRMDMGNRDRGGMDRSESFSGDWRSGPRAEVQQDEREQRRGGFTRDRDERGGSGFTRDRDERGGGGPFTRENMRNGGAGGGGGGGFTRRDDDRPGGWRDARDQDRGQDRDRDRGFVRRDNFRDSDRTSRFDDREDRRGGGGGGGGFRRFDDRERDSGYSRGRDERDPEPVHSEGRARPRLVLAPRTKPIENVPAKSETTATTTTVPSASIFGDAKPVDTAKREKEIEEKLLKGKDHDTLARESSRERWAPRAPPPREPGEKDEGVVTSSVADDDDDDDDGSRVKQDVDRSRYSRRRDESPRDERREVAPAATAPPKKTYDDKRATARNNDKSADRGEDKSRSEKPKVDKREKEMPKLAEPEPPNFAASNKFAFLPTDEDNSD